MTIISRPEHNAPATVNGVAVQFDDRKVTGREILSEAGFDPASEHVLIMIQAHDTLLIGLDQKVDLDDKTQRTFRAFRNDRVFNFTMEERGYVWGESPIAGAELINLAHLDGGQTLLLERENEPDIRITEQGAVELGNPGTEHLRKRPTPGPEFVFVTVFATGGIYPAEGAAKQRADEQIEHILKKTKHALEITDTTNWVASANGVELNPSNTYAQSGLSGLIEIEWHLREGGGGDE